MFALNGLLQIEQVNSENDDSGFVSLPLTALFAS